MLARFLKNSSATDKVSPKYFWRIRLRSLSGSRKVPGMTKSVSVCLFRFHGLLLPHGQLIRMIVSFAATLADSLLSVCPELLTYVSDSLPFAGARDANISDTPPVGGHTCRKLGHSFPAGGEYIGTRVASDADRGASSHTFSMQRRSGHGHVAQESRCGLQIPVGIEDVRATKIAAEAAMCRATALTGRWRPVGSARSIYISPRKSSVPPRIYIFSPVARTMCGRP